MSEHHHACVTPASPTFAPKRLGGGEAAVIVTVLILAGSLALTGMPVDQIVQILSWAGLIAVALITQPAPARCAVSPVRYGLCWIRAANAEGPLRGTAGEAPPRQQRRTGCACRPPTARTPPQRADLQRPRQPGRRLQCHDASARGVRRSPAPPGSGPSVCTCLRSRHRSRRPTVGGGLPAKSAGCAGHAAPGGTPPHLVHSLADLASPWSLCMRHTAAPPFDSCTSVRVSTLVVSRCPRPRCTASFVVWRCRRPRRASTRF